MSFIELGVMPSLAAKLQAMSILEPMPIQSRVLPVALRPESILVNSQTGSGKTLAYLLPLIQLLGQGERRALRALVLTPTRELAQQVGDLCSQLCEAVELSCCVVVGGVEYAAQREALAASPDIVIATPGRLIDLLEQGAAAVEAIDYFVLDEVDQMLDLGFHDSIISLAALRSSSSVTFCFSATLPDDVIETVEAIAPSITRLSLEGESLSVETVEHLGYYVSFEMMDTLLLHLLRSEQPEQAIVFTRSRKMADRVVGVLSQGGFAAEAMHSDRSQAAREHILGRFRARETKIIVATDVIARGIDIDTVSHVFNYGLPQNEQQYIHRCGRCGRAGRSGRALSIFTPEERPILNAICRLMRRHITLDENHPYLTPDVTQALSGVTSKRSKAKPKRR